jgi:2-hydroxychromene-2-carboxylate isomerase
VAVLYFDLNSPYAYLAVERAESVLGAEPELEPVLLGAIFKQRGWGSWAHTDERDERLFELYQRTEHYGLPPLVLPDGWPLDGLQAMRAATWAKQQGAVEAFALGVFRRQFVEGRDGSSLEALADVADDVGLDGDELCEAIQTPEIKDALRAATAGAWKAGVRGIPTLRVGERLFYGDDQLDAAA